MVDSLSDGDDAKRGSERANRSTSSFFAETFEKQFPYYLSIGMTPEQYWDGDAKLVVYYREAENLRKERVNQEAWLQGMYIYDTIQRLSSILRPFAKRASAEPYVEEPYPISKKTMKEANNKKEKEIHQKGLAYMQSFMLQNNTKFKGEE